jgi:ATP-dependent helicase HrpA
MDEVVALERRYRAVLAGFGRRPVPAEVVELGWMLEEVRVAVFAQSLGAAKGASAARVARRLTELGG